MVTVIKKLLLVIVCMAAMALPAATVPHGADRLRELVVFPEFNLGFKFGMTFQGTESVIQDNTPTEVAIERLRAGVKQQPDNTEQLMQLGVLLSQNDETNEAQACFEHVEQLARKRTEANPQDGPALTLLGKSLWQLKRPEEAESAYRHAVLVSSNDWHCWIGLGNFLSNAKFSGMFPADLSPQSEASPEAMQQAILDYRPPAEALRAAETSLAEAGKYFDRAIALAPKKPEVLFQYAGYQATVGWENCFFRHCRDNEAIDSNKILFFFLSQGTLTNLEKAAELDSKNYELTALWAYFTWMQANEANKGTNAMAGNALPNKPRQSIRTAMTRLENLSGSPDKKVAAGALENHGLLEMIFGNNAAAITDLRQAVALDSTQESAWDLLLGFMHDSASPEELETACVARVKINGSARNRLLLTKVYTMEKKWNEAVKQAQIAGEMETNSIIPPLFLAAIALKQSMETNHLEEAGDQLRQAGNLLKVLPATKDRTDRWREFVLNVAIYNGLIGQPDIAKTWLNEVFKGFPNDETAEAISQALE